MDLFYLRQSLHFPHVECFVHVPYLRLRRSPQYLDDLLQLVNLRVAKKGGHSIDHLNQDTASRPHVDLRRVICGSEDELRSPVAPRADIGEIRLL